MGGATRVSDFRFYKEECTDRLVVQARGITVLMEETQWPIKAARPISIRKQDLRATRVPQIRRPDPTTSMAARTTSMQRPVIRKRHPDLRRIPKVNPAARVEA